MQVIRVDAHRHRDAEAFLRLPRQLYRQVPQWVPLFAGEEPRLIARRHPFFEHSEAEFFLAVDGGDAVGRVAVLQNRNYNEYNQTRRAHFCLFESIDDEQVSQALFDAARRWARERGMEQLKGPKGFGALDGVGMLVEGFDYVPALGIPYNMDYYPRLVRSAGLTAVDDIYSGRMLRSRPFPEKIHRVAQAVQRRRGLSVRTFRTKRELARYAPQIGALYNRSLGLNADNVPLTDDELGSLVRRLLPIAEPRLVKAVVHGDEPVGFLLAYPDVARALQRCGGRMGPLGWLEMARERRHTLNLNINGIGIVKEYQGLGGTALMYSELQKTVLDSRFETGELVQIRGENAKMQRELRRLGVEFHKVHRLYECDL